MTALHIRGLWFVLLLVAAFSLVKSNQQASWSPVDWSPINGSTLQASDSATPYYHEQLIPNAGQKATHSVSVTVLPSGDLMAFWFAGSREGHRDVRIFQTTFQQQKQRWLEPQAILDVPYLDDVLGRYIGKVGNPVAFVDKQKRLWLFFVSVSYGGWAGSSLNVMWSEDFGQSWNAPKRLITSPFINVSTLVRNSILQLEDGSLLLPIYHEFVAQFPETLRISRDGEVMRKTRMYGHGGGIQPVFVEGKDGDIFAFLRSGVHTKDWRVISLKSINQGESWQQFKLTELPNPNSALIAARVDKDLWVWIGNYSQTDRRNMTLAVSDDLDKAWSIIHQFENGKAGTGFAYPVMIQDQQGLWHVLYTYNRTHIKHIRFNRAWLDQQRLKQGEIL